MISDSFYFLGIIHKVTLLNVMAIQWQSNKNLRAFNFKCSLNKGPHISKMIKIDLPYSVYKGCFRYYFYIKIQGYGKIVE